MAHFKGEVHQTRNESLKFLTKQRDIFSGAVKNLTDTIAQIDNCKRMLLMVAVDQDGSHETPLDLDQEAPLPPPIGSNGG